MGLILLLFYWVGLPILAFLLVRKLRRSAKTPNTKRLSEVFGVALFAGLFWVLAGEKLFYDTQVRYLCGKDGGIKVYETVKLPNEQFNQWGQIDFYRPTQGENALGGKYSFKRDVHYYRRGNPQVSRERYQVVRHGDNKLLGEAIRYGRGGGDLPGPWHPSSFSCPSYMDGGPNALLKKIFVSNNKGNKDEQQP